MCTRHSACGTVHIVWQPLHLSTSQCTFDSLLHMLRRRRGVAQDLLGNHPSFKETADGNLYSIFLAIHVRCVLRALRRCTEVDTRPRARC